MRRVVSVSLGSAARDSSHQMKVLGEEILIERRGTDGDLGAAKRLLQDLDGKVDAIGLGGISLHLYAGSRPYVIREALELVRVVKETPVVDGSGVKSSLETRLPRYVEDKLGISLQGKETLIVSAVDRFALGDALQQAGCRMVIGDVVYALGLPFPLYSMRAINNLATLLLPVMTQLPLAWLYPTGKDQERQVKQSKGAELIERAEVVAGDYHYIRKHLPDSMRDKIVITNTITAEDRAMLRARGPVFLVTTSPNYAGRSYATNVIEALIVAVSGRAPQELTPQDYLDYARAMDLSPTAEWLRPAGSDAAQAGADAS